MDRNDLDFGFDYVDVCKDALQSEAAYFADNLTISDYYEGYDIDDLIKQNTYVNECGYDVDIDTVTKTVADRIIGEVQDDIYEKLSGLNNQEIGEIEIPTIEIDEVEIAEMVKSHLESDYDEDFHRENIRSSSYNYEDEISLIFER